MLIRAMQIGKLDQGSSGAQAAARDIQHQAAEITRDFVDLGRDSSAQRAATNRIIPLLLHQIGIAIPDDIASVGIDWSEPEIAFVTDLKVSAVEPGIEQWIGCYFYLLVR